MHCCLRRTELSEQAPSFSPPQLDQNEREQLFERCLTEYSDASFPLEWFSGQPIQRENLRVWLCYALFSCKLEETEGRYDEELEGYVTRIEQTYNTHLSAGKNERVKAVWPGFDETKMLHRPLIWYIVSSPPSRNFNEYLLVACPRHRHYCLCLSFLQRLPTLQPMDMDVSTKTVGAVLSQTTYHGLSILVSAAYFHHERSNTIRPRNRRK